MSENIKKGIFHQYITLLLMLFLFCTYAQDTASHNNDININDEPNALSTDETVEIVPHYYDEQDHNNEKTMSDNTENNTAELQKKENIEEEEEEKREEERIEEIDENIDESPSQQKPLTSRRINAIIITGSKHTSPEAILTHIPYKIGEMFTPNKTKSLIHNLYYGLKRFRSIKVMGELVDKDFINLHIIVEEKLPFKEIKTEGNKHVSEKEIAKKINLEEIKAIDPEDLTVIANQIKEIYLEKGYNQTIIDTNFMVDDENRATAMFTVHEGPMSIVKQIHFTGNKHISSKELRAILLTREDWLLSFLDKAGNYNPDRLEADKHFIEQYYQNHGFLHAKVFNIDTNINPTTQNIVLTFEIEEGEQYTIESITAPGTAEVPENYLLAMLPIRPGMLYSRDGIANSIKRLELIWGDYGYIFAHIEPSVQPNEETKTVALSFFSDLGDKVFLNKITIKGNKKTRDKIIRRKILLEEGELLTQNRMNASKRNVASLGYFDPRDGVNWKIKRLNKNEADLDLIVKETKTGHLGAQIGFGGAGADLRSPLSGFSLKGELSDTNLFGSGVNINLSATYSKDEQTAAFHLSQPWMFDKPILGAFDLYHRRPIYDELRHVKTVHEKLTGGSLTAGFITQSQKAIMNDVNVLFIAGTENITYTTPPQALLDDIVALVDYQRILNKEFTPGTFAYVSAKMEQDMRNHPVHTLWGHRWRLSGKFAIPTFGNNIGFYKIELDASWYTTLIAEYDLVLRMHGFFGVASPFKNRSIPFGDLFHIGGQNSIRGFLFGQIGPQFLGDTIGGSKAFFLNVELVMPITSDMNMKGVIFYDGGTGFHNPYVENTSQLFVTQNKFDYRHAIGIGIRLLQPMPINIDWGFKIDPRKNRLDPSKDESASEVHFGMSYDW